LKSYELSDQNSFFRFRFTLDGKLFDGATFYFEIEHKNIVKVQHQVDGSGWVDIDKTSHNIQFSEGKLMLSTMTWQPYHFYDVRVLLSSGDDQFDSIEFYGCTVKGMNICHC